jgi:predicted phosphoribosyltransferase
VPHSDGQASRARTAIPRPARSGLAEQLRKYAGRDDVIVLALPRGGVPVGYEVARELRAPLDVFIVRKLGIPGMAEVAMGAIASGGVRVLNEDVIARLPQPDRLIEYATAQETPEMEPARAKRRDKTVAPAAPATRDRSNLPPRDRTLEALFPRTIAGAIRYNHSSR